MKIATIGTGNIGGTLASHWSKAGHQIHLGVRNVDNFKGKELVQNSNVTVHTIFQAVDFSEVILVATPPQFAVDLINQMGDLDGKVIIDATNTIKTDPDQTYPTAFHALADLTKAAIVKCFNTTGFENMDNPKIGDTFLDMFMAGDSSKAKTIAKTLALEIGFENCYDFGGNDKVQLLEKFALCWINLSIFQKMGRGIGFKLLKRNEL